MEYVPRWWHIIQYIPVYLGILGLLSQCSPARDSEKVSPPAAPGAQTEQQAVENLLTLYRTAMLQEDIDRLHELLHSDDVALQSPLAGANESGDEPCVHAMAFSEEVSHTFRAHTLLALQIPQEMVEIAADLRNLTFVEVHSREDPTALEQQTLLFRTTWQITRQATEGKIAFRIAAVCRAGPLLRVVTPGQAQAGVLTRLLADGMALPFAPIRVEVQDIETEAWQALVPSGQRTFTGAFRAPLQKTACLPVRVQGAQGEAWQLAHCYRIQRAADGVLQRVAGTETVRFFAVAVGQGRSIWAGGASTRSGTIGTIFHRTVDGHQRFEPALPTKNLPADVHGCIEDIAMDYQGRMHFLFLARMASAGCAARGGVIAGGAVIWDPQYPEAGFCQTVNAATDPQYPFLAPRDASQRSPATRVIAADERAVWLAGSDGGVARVEDEFQEGKCPSQDVGVRYGPVYRRGANALLANTVPALVAGQDGTLWFGTALGLTRLQQGQFTPMPFQPGVSLHGNVATLEMFFQQVAMAIFQARPIAAVEFQGVSFQQEFGQELFKEDLIWSAVEDAPGRLWVGTLGGGLRRIEGETQTRHLTRQDGLVSNRILALAKASEDVVWVATDKGIQRLQAAGGEVAITTLTALNGLSLPVRDVAVESAGVVWLATDAGLLRWRPQGGGLQGVVHNEYGQPVAGADVRVLGTPLQTVTDTVGRYTFLAVAPGRYRLEVHGQLATEMPYAQREHDVVVTEGVQNVEPIVVAPTEVFLDREGGDAQTGVVGRRLPQPLVFSVHDATGQPVPQHPFIFNVMPGNGSLTKLMSEAPGQTSVLWTLGTQAGLQRVEVKRPGAELPVLVFTAHALADRESARLKRVKGNNQIGLGRIAEPLIVRLEDQFGNPLVGEVVQAKVLEGEVEFVAGKTQETNAQGEAQFEVQVSTLSTIVVDMVVPALPQAAPVRFFLNRMRYAVAGDSPRALAAADVDGDTIVDIVTANGESDNVSILLGQEEGTFLVAHTVSVGDLPQAVAVVDVNGDTILDIVTANGLSHDISVLLGKENGTFPSPQRRQSLEEGRFPRGIAVEDVNGDGKVDVVTANEGSDTISVLLGNGDGTFGVFAHFRVGAAPGAVVLADVNGDEKLDVVTTNRDSDDVSVLFGHGDGTFATAQFYAVGDLPRAVAVAYVNDDGWPDMVTANGLSDNVSVLLGRGDGTFAPPMFLAVGTFPRAVAVIDLDNDTVVDIVTANGDSDDVSVLRGEGNGIFAASQTFVTGKLPVALVVVDVDGDKVEDVVTANANSNDISVLLGQGDGTLVAPRHLGVGSSPRAVVVADIDNDGRKDVVTANGFSDNVSVLVGQGAGTFAAAVTYRVGLFPVAVVVQDVNDDEIPDIITANGGSNDVSVLLGKGDATFQPFQSFAAGNFPRSLAVVDVDGDKVMDVVTANGFSQNVSVLLGRGGGIFADPVTYRVGSSLLGVAVADVDEDGSVDIVTANGSSQDIAVLLGQGNGTFASPPRIVPVGRFPEAVVVADIDRDENLDVVTANGNSGDVSILLGKGDGTFGESVHLVVGTSTRAVAVADVDGDPFPDIVTANERSNDVSVLRGRGDGTFMAVVAYKAGSAPWAVAVADINGDDFPDVITANERSNDVSVILGQGKGIFGAPVVSRVSCCPEAMVVEDVNGDTIPDVVTANEQSNNVSILLGQDDGTLGGATDCAVGKSPRALAVVDVNEDTVVDVVTANAGSDDISILLGKIDGACPSVTTVPLGQSPRAMAVEDVNGDEKRDVVTVTRAGDLRVLLGDGTGTFTAVTPVPIGRFPEAFAVGDVDGNGTMDVVTANAISYDVSVLLGKGDGTFVVRRHRQVGYSPRAIVMAHTNGDAFLDIVTANGFSKNVSVLQGKGDGTFAAAQSFHVGRFPRAVVVAHVDDDTIVDIVTANEESDDVSVLQGKGDGTFMAGAHLLAGSSPRAVAVQDMNRDGSVDIVVANFDSFDISIVRGLGGGNFE